VFPQTVQQVKRWFKIVAGFTLLFVGIVMIVTPGPGWLVILMGLALLAAEYVWARRLLDRLKAQGERLKAGGERLRSSLSFSSHKRP